MTRTIAIFMQLPYRLLAVLSVLLLAAVAVRGEDTNKAAAAKPAEQKLAVILVWATDDDKPAEKDEELKAVESGMREKLKFFKWKNYFQVGEKKHISIKPGQTKDLELSHKCKLKLHQNEKAGLEVELIGEGTPVIKRNQTMPLKDILIIGGDDKDANAWMVVLKPE